MIDAEVAVRKGLIGGVQRFSTEDGPGIRTVIFLKGCPLRCEWCHNPELLRRSQVLLLSTKRCIQCGECEKVCPEQAIHMTASGPVVDRDLCNVCGLCVEVCNAEALRIVGDAKTVDEVVDIVKRDESFYESTGGGLTLSGGEPLMQGAFAVEIATACRQQNISVAIETSGQGDYEVLRTLAELSVQVLYDVKAIDTNKHRELTHFGNEAILQNLEALCEDDELRAKIVIRTPLMAGLNDSVEDVLGVAHLVKRLGLSRMELLPYHEMGVAKGREVGVKQAKFQTPTDEHLRQLLNFLEEEGISAGCMGLKA